MASELSPEDSKLRQTIAWELTNAGNYPKPVAVQVLGRDMTPIIDAVFNALKREGYKKGSVASPPDTV